MKIKRIIAGLMALVMVIASAVALPTTEVKAGVNAGNLQTNKNYMIVSKSSGKAMTISGNSKENSASLIQKDAEGYASQVWRLEDVGNGYYRIVNYYSDKALDVPNSSTEKGKNIIQWDKGNGDNQKWKISDAGNGLCRISPKVKESFGLNVSGNSKEGGAQIITWNYDGADNMKWEFKEVSSVKENPQLQKADAQAAMDAFLKMFLNDKGSTSEFKKVSGHWAEAETIEVVMDAYDRYGDTKYLDITKELLDEYIKDHKREWWNGNEYNDDIMWSCILFARYYLATGEQEYINIAKANFDAVWTRAWTDQYGGGLEWKENHGDQTKNACVNGPGAIAACYIGQALGDEGYYEKAKMMIDWMISQLVNEEGRVGDNMGMYHQNENDPSTPRVLKYKLYTFTYNQGTFIGACTLLYEKYKEQKYYDYAYNASKYCLENPGGVNLNGESNNADLIGFKGILARWMSKFTIMNNVTDFNQYMQTWADTAWTNRNSDNLMGTKFGEQTIENIQECQDKIGGGANQMDQRRVGDYSAWGCSSAVSWLVNCADIAERQVEYANRPTNPGGTDGSGNTDAPIISVEPEEVVDIVGTPEADNGQIVDIGNSNSNWDIKSPDGSTVINVKLNNGKLRYSVKQNNQTIVEESDMGIKTSKGDFTNGLSFTSASAKKVHETYGRLSGNFAEHTNHCHEATLVFKKDNVEFQVIARAYNDGVAFRYTVNSSGEITIDRDQERTSFVLPNSSNVWYMNYYDKKVGEFMYEEDYKNVNINNISNDVRPSMPLLYKTGNKFALITEAEKRGTYVGSMLKPEGNRVLRTVFDEKEDKVKTTAPFKTPWRSIVIGDLSTIATNTMVENLSPAPDEAQYNFTEWVEPGVSSWSWVGNWGSGSSDQSLESTHVNYIDLAAAMGWKYYIMDERWQPNGKNSRYEGYREWFYRVRDYANEKGVNLIAWVHKDDMDTAAERESRFKQWSQDGIKGIKVDFFYNESQEMLQLQDDIYKEAAKYHLLVNVHGSNPPSGERRTYPNVIAREAIKGQEQGGITANQYTLIPFLRAAVGTADVTEELYSKDDKKTSMGFQIALSVLVENGIRSLGGEPSDYLGIPSAVSFYKNFPASWDDTKLLDSNIGEYVNIARKAGDAWYAAGISVNARDISLNTDFLDSGKNYTAIMYHEKDENERNNLRTEIRKNITKGTKLNFHVQNGGGYAVKIVPTTGSLQAIKAFPSEIKVQAQKTKDIQAIFTPSNTTMTDMQWSTKNSSIATVTVSASGATIKGIKEGTTEIIGTSVIDASKTVTVKVTVTAEKYPMNTGTWNVLNNTGKYKINNQNSVTITAENGVVDKNVFVMGVPNNANNFSIEAKISGGLRDNYQGAFLGVFKKSGTLENNYVGFGRRYHGGFNNNGHHHLALMGNGGFEKYAEDSKEGQDIYVKLEKNNNKFTGYYKYNANGNWNKFKASDGTQEVTRDNLKNSSDLYIGFYTGCGGGNSAIDVTFTDFTVGNSKQNVASYNSNAEEETFTVEFDTAGGTAFPLQMLKANQKVTKPADPINGNSKFLGWYVNNKEFDFNTGITKDTLIVAKWEASENSLRVEAEAGELAGSASLSNNGEASNGYHVGDLGGPEAGTATYYVNVDTAGRRTMKLYYIQNMERSFKIAVNGGNTINVACDNTGSWTKPGTTPQSVSINLKAGENTIVISGDNNFAPNLDRIEFVLAPNEAKATVETMIAKLPESVTTEDKVKVYAIKAAYESLRAIEGVDVSSIVGVDKLQKAVDIVDGKEDSATDLQALRNRFLDLQTRKNGLTQSEYTTTSWNEMLIAYNAARTEYNKANPDAATLQTLVEAFEKELNDLEKTASMVTVTFDTKGGSGIASKTISKGEKVGRPANPTRTGYIFENWYLGNQVYNFDSAVNSNITLTAKWQVGNEVEAVKGDFVYLENVMNSMDKSAYSQDSWNAVLNAYNAAKAEYDKEEVDVDVLRELLTELSNAMDALVEVNCIVTFNSAGGSAVSSQSVVKGGMAEQPANPNRAGYVFVGWYTAAGVYNFATPVNSNIILTAKWQLEGSYGQQVGVQQIVIEGESNQVAVGKKTTLTATVTPGNAANQTLVWESSNTKYATVVNGVVTTKKAGKNKTVTIIAKAADGSGTVGTYKIKIMPKAVKKIKLIAKKSVKAGKQIKIKTKVTPNGKKVNTKLVWSSSNEAYATVNSKGVVKTTVAGKGKTVKITAKATDGSKKKTAIKIKIK